jgi:hypothetical protein
VGGGWALEIESFLGPMKLNRADRRVPFGAQKTQNLPLFLLIAIIGSRVFVNVDYTLTIL